MKRALLSVTDKSGIAEFAQGLAALGYEILSTGGTATVLRKAALIVLEVDAVTKFPEMLDGRIKTLHPLIHGAILGDRTKESHREQMSASGIGPIDVVCVNLYDFEKTISSEPRFEDAIESIDIGGPAMIRAAAKNHSQVTVVVDPADYPTVIESLKRTPNSTERAEWAAKAFRHTAFYDSMIARWLSARAGNAMPEHLTLGFRRARALRYGENPHQQAALYVDPLAKSGIAQARQLWGKELSYNNLLDADAAWELACDLPVGSCAIIKHGNPCGVAMGPSLVESYTMARRTDPVSAFGGIVALNVKIDDDAARAMVAKGNFLEVVIGTGFTVEAVKVFSERSGWGQDVRLLEVPLAPESSVMTLRAIRGGALVQDSDEEPPGEWCVVTERAPSESELSALKLMWTVARHVKSNAIVVGNSNQMLGIGAGQMNRVHSVRLALDQAGEHARAAALASDAFFPFPDSIEAAAEAGITAIVQPGGSKKDSEVIEAANQRRLTMVFTGVRHFRH